MDARVRTYDAASIASTHHGGAPITRACAANRRVPANHGRPALFLRWLVMLAVLLCSMHFADPASAHATTNDAAAHFFTDGDEPESGDPGPGLTHVAHHHCPVAPDIQAPRLADAPDAATAPIFAAPALPLASRRIAPLLDPPLL